MSLAHELRVLELETQTELLDRLQLLTRFGSNLININGVSGSGKTWLAQRYLEAWASEKINLFFSVSPHKPMSSNVR